MEPHWTAVAFVPLVLLSVPAIEQKVRLKKWVFILGWVTIPFILLIRLALVVDFDVIPDKVSRRFHNKEAYFKEIHKEARGRPVVFINSFQKPSLYWFFTNEPAFTQNNYRYRKNQYDLWNMEADLQGKEVLYLPHSPHSDGDTLLTVRGEVFTHNTEYFCSFNRVEINLPVLLWEFEAGEQVEIELKLSNPTEQTIDFTDSCSFKPLLLYTILAEGATDVITLARYHDHLPILEPGESIFFPVEITAPEVQGEYQLLFSFGAKGIAPGIHGRPVKMMVHSTSTGNSMYK